MRAGISRERLESFDRPVRCEPEYFGHCREQLIKDFEHYLGILKAVHSGADLQNAAKNAGGQLPGSAKGHLGYVLASRGSNQARPALRPPAISSGAREPIAHPLFAPACGQA